MARNFSLDSVDDAKGALLLCSGFFNDPWDSMDELFVKDEDICDSFSAWLKAKYPLVFALADKELEFDSMYCPAEPSEVLSVLYYTESGAKKAWNTASSILAEFIVEDEDARNAYYSVLDGLIALK